MQITFYKPSRPCCYHTDKASSSLPYRELACHMQHGRKQARGLQGPRACQEPALTGRATRYKTEPPRDAPRPLAGRGAVSHDGPSRGDGPAITSRHAARCPRLAPAAYCASARRPPRPLSWAAVTRMLARMATWMAARHGLLRGAARTGSDRRARPRDQRTRGPRDRKALSARKAARPAAV